ncbi:hypothetical protein MATL_G00244590 [Megalops atlanticus]|uniref:Uncharacterized protein n=1 Tax=Megalops atlanticus TaxID=7932 RepID=A0A9D3SWJ5_MEGAT|nr:hypothetical protein MATL_G00244590 [Megalops atlanticus]
MHLPQHQTGSSVAMENGTINPSFEVSTECPSRRRAASPRLPRCRSWAILSTPFQLSRPSPCGLSGLCAAKRCLPASCASQSCFVTVRCIIRNFPAIATAFHNTTILENILHKSIRVFHSFC